MNDQYFSDFYKVPGISFDIKKLRADLDRVLKQKKFKTLGITNFAAIPITIKAVKKLWDKLSIKKSQFGNGSSCFKLSKVGNHPYFKEPLKNFTTNRTPNDTRSGIAPKKMANFQCPL